MNHIFKKIVRLVVPDDTVVYPFLNSNDSESGLPVDLLNGMSMAIGVLSERYIDEETGEEKISASRSKIHIMPHVTQVTYVQSGSLRTIMKDPDSATYYENVYQAGEAALTKAGTYLQLINNSDEPCELLYNVTPAYLFVMDDDFFYDDSVVFDEDWTDFETYGWQSPKPLPTLDDRAEALKRLRDGSN